MADEFLLMRSRQKHRWRQQEAERRRHKLDFDSSQSDSVAVESKSGNDQHDDVPPTVGTNQLNIDNDQGHRKQNDETTIRSLHTDGIKSRTIPATIGFQYTKSSPGSSVSLTQSPSGKGFDLNSKRTDASKLGADNISVNSNNLNGTKIEATKQCESSSDEEDLLQWVRDKNLRKESGKPNRACNVMKTDTEETIRNNEAPKFRSGIGSNLCEISGAHSRPIMASNAFSGRSFFLDSSSSDDDDNILRGWRANKSTQKDRTILKNSDDSITNEDRPISSLDSRKDPLPISILTKEKSPPRNPLTVNNEFVLPDPVPISKEMEDLLWADSDNENGEVSSALSISKKRKSPHSEGITDGVKKSKGEQIQKPHDKVSIGKKLNETDHSTIYDVESLGKIPMPEFNNPRFGPFEYKPLLLSLDNNDGISEKYEVPASINRYLPKYQQDGIRFIFNAAIASQRGAILGDDMGLGKTIQIVALVAALLKKTGTGHDLIELKRRTSLARSLCLKQQETMQQSLLHGKLTTQVCVDIKQQLQLPLWSPVLVLSPNGVVFDAWYDAFMKWGHFAVAKYQGSERESELESIVSGMKEVLLCPKSLFERKEHIDRLLGIKWKIIFIDEFHTFKNERGLMAMNLRLMRDSLDCVVIGLTGTVMQNDHKELWNLIDLAAKNFVGPWSEFEAKFARPIKLARTKDASSEAIELGRMKGMEFTNQFSEIYLRRTKKEVLSDVLPTKAERIVFCEPSHLQKELYKHVLQQPDFKLLSESCGPCDCGINQKFFSEFQHLKTKSERIEYQRKYKKKVVRRCDCCYQVPRQMNGAPGIDPKAVVWRQHHPNDKPCKSCPFCILFPLLHILYKLSSHASLLQLKISPEQLQDGTEARQSAEDELEKAKVFLPDHLLDQLPGQQYVRQDRIMDNHFRLSGKMVVVDKLLRAIKLQQGRVLLFSYSTQTLDLIQNYLVTEGYSYLRMDGSTPIRRRTELATEFTKSNDIFVFLLSTKAMGLGLNLTEANFVIIFDVDWNPSNDAQAQDRAYRIGQEKDVKVFRLVSRGTVEELKYLRQVYKTQLTSETIVERNDFEQHTSAARMFRGVAGDVTRKGELFGLANLLKFNDGPFMNYATKESESKQFGVGVHDTDALMQNIVNMTEEDLDDIGNNADVYDDIATRREHDSTCVDINEVILGGESQVMYDMCERFDMGPSHMQDEKSQKVLLPGGRNQESDDDSVPNTASESVSTLCQNIPRLTLIATIGGSDASTQHDGITEKHTSNKSCEPEDRLSTSIRRPQILQSTISDVKNTGLEITRDPTSQFLNVQKVKSNQMLVGKTTNKMKRGEAGRTTFRPCDLYIPAGDTKKKKSKVKD